MPSPHASVIYVEPNMEPIKDGWAVEDTFERAPRLEDYCVAMNIEVEVCSRDKVDTMSQNLSEVLIMQWRNDNGENKKDFVNFMGGTKIGEYNIDGVKRTPRLENTYDALTTYYADMYVGDLVDYGTTEMVGIKSVNIEYERSCVPIITVVFTDVRGMSIFQPQELARDNVYNGIKGIDKHNVAQSFFQCFFKMPLPKFTIYIKGFYGKPVAYEVMCDKFDTNFNSDTGDFEVTTRFIGYAYSFLTDVSMDALIAAPYSDYRGKEYWEEKVNSGEFFVYDKTGKVHKKMPTLCDIVTRYNELSVTGKPEDEATTVEYEESNHEIEIKELKDIRDNAYTKWYDNLYSALSSLFNKEGEQRCFDFRETGTDADYMYLLLLTDASGDDDLSGLYQNGLQGFHELNETVYNTIKTYNEKETKFKELNNVSLDFSDYRKIRIFNEITSKVVNIQDGEIITREQNPDFAPSLPKALKTEFLQRLFYYHNVDSGGNESSESIYDETVRTIKQNGKKDKQLLYGYVIKVDYSAVKERVNALNSEMNKSDSQKTEEKRLKEINDKMMAKMDFYPSIENFTRVMMAHFETFMDMMYGVANEIIEEKRTPSSLGISTGEDGTVQDTNKNDKYIPPFPRVTQKVIGDDNITRNEDAWVGTFNDGDGFKEVDVVDGLFNGIDEVLKLVEESNTVLEDNKKGVELKTEACKVPCPITSYDFFINTSPYGEDSETLNDLDAFIGRVAIRMFDILSVSSFRLGGVMGAEPDIPAIAKVEAINFDKTSVMNNSTLVNALGHDENSSTLKTDAIMDLIFNNKSLHRDGRVVPWAASNKDRVIFSNSTSGNGIWMNLFSSHLKNDESDKQWYYPIQGGTFSGLESDFKMFIDPKQNNLNRNSVEVDNFAVRKEKLTNTDFKTFMSSTNRTGLNSVFFSDNHSVVKDILEKSAPDDTEQRDYSAIYNLIVDNAKIPGNDVKPFIKDNNVIMKRTGVLRPGGGTQDFGDAKNGNFTVKYNESNSKMVASTKGSKSVEYNEPIDDYYDMAEDSSFGDITITEMRGIEKEKSSGSYKLSRDKSLFMASGGTNYRLENLDPTMKTAFAIETIEGIDYNYIRKYLSVYYNNGNPNLSVFSYVPRLVILQIGAAIYAYADRGGMPVGYKVTDFTGIDKCIPLTDSARAIVSVKTGDKYVNRMNMSFLIHCMSPLTRFAYAKYFKDWSDSDDGKNFRSILDKMKNRDSDIYLGKYDKKRCLLNENNQSIQNLTSDLLTMVLVTKGNVNYSIDISSSMPRVGFKREWVEKYFSAFLDKLRVLHNFKQEDIIDSNGVVHRAATPKKTTDDMRIELYRYLKLLYDKWIPTNPQISWSMKSFFDDGVESDEIRNLTGGGHLFHFIDSYYNKLGNKLLLNVGKLASRITQLLKSNDVSVMMLGFMADIYSDNKCMMMCIQNFLDMSSKDNMMKMFKPIPYNEMPSPKKHPDFVVIYPYEPSKNLDINNGEFKDDGFMLNDEDYTPIAIRSRGDNEDSWYRIPAFGVSYGKQYQNYFKRVNVNMASPIATQQSIIAKHTILKMSNGDSTKGTQGQDMYDVYSTQSYTCTVEMMGCAWIQPMMYFVLTNVPMFKGSYMIMKVTHNITPGNMTTTFTGCRMSRNSNKLVEHVFTDDLDPNSSDYSIDSKRERLANVDNNCPYKVFNLFESSDLDITGDESELYPKAMELLMGKYGFEKTAAAGICGNIYKESTWNLHVVNGIGAYGLCQWLGERRTLLFSKYGKKPNFGNQIEYIDYEWSNESVAKNHRGDLNKAKSPEDAAYIVRKFFERPGEKEADDATRKKKARYYFDNYQKPTPSVVSKNVKPDKATPEDVRAEFMRCLQMSVDSTDSGKVKLNGTGTTKVGKYTFIDIVQENGNRDKLPLVFDIILNGYYNYVQELWWVYNGDNELKKDPIKISVCVSMSVETNKRRVFLVNKSNLEKSMGNTFDVNTIDSVNINFLKSIRKKYGDSYTADKNKYEIPQFPDAKVLDKSTISVANCEDMINTVHVSGDKSTWAKSVQSMGKWYEANVHEYNQSAMIACDLLDGGKVRKDCSGYVSACLQYFGAFKKGYITNSTGFVADSNVAGMLNNAGFRKMTYSWDTVEPYDIIAYKGHVEILAEKGERPKSWGWGSTHDCKNGHACMPAGTGNKPKGNTYTTIWRYVGSGKG